jgi:atlastin
MDPTEAKSTEKEAATKVQPVQSEDHDWDKVSDDIPEEMEGTADTPNAEQKTATNTNASTALQIVSIGTETDQYAFTFHEDALASIMEKVPSEHKVCVVSVVGAFRTGKSFLLSWFLRYLNHIEAEDKKSDHESDSDGNKQWYDREETLGNDGFDWRGGAERNTTGIWIWSKPFILPRNANSSEKIALLLVDTQGMFDHETTMGLTAAIFGLSTLLSSYQIYNVDKRIQEDNLQQLALFSEYGRMALQADGHKGQSQRTNLENEHGDKGQEKKKTSKPFQKIEFLVRDWQNFEDDEDMESCEREMKEYLESVIAERQASDLKDTREQITSCFEEVSCFLMTHPGFAVTKKKYSGDVSVVEPIFKSFMDCYCKRVFSNLVAKSIHGRELTAVELGAYIQNYANMFETGAQFPEAATMLEATASANNSNATSLSIKLYKAEMDNMAGAKCSDYLDPTELENTHRKVFEQSAALFDGIANFGSLIAIEKARNEVIESIEESFEMYTKMNEGRNPLLGMETYIIPLSIGAIAMILRWIADFTCSSWSDTCRVGSDVLSHVYQVVFFFMIIVASTKAKQISQAAGKVKKAFNVMSDSGSQNKKSN